MGLNVNYSLLIEANNVNHKIPDYRKTYNPLLFTEDCMMQYLFDFNQEIRESRALLDNIVDDNSTIYEGAVLVNIVNFIKEAANRVKDAIFTLFTKIKDLFMRLFQAIEDKVGSMKDKIEEKYRFHERMQILKKALNDAEADEKTVNISDINPTKDLIDKDFPDVSIIGSSLVKMTTDTMNNYCINLVQKDGTVGLIDDTEVKASESFVNFIENEKEGMLAKIFGKYSYDPTNIAKSAAEASEKAFGSTERNDTQLTPELYSLACDNMDQSKDIVKDMRALFNETDNNFKKVMAEMDSISKSVEYFDRITNKPGFDFKENYHTAVKTVVGRIKRAFSVIQEVINADYSIICHKAIRVQEIYGVSGDSNKVKKACHKLISRYVTGEEPTNEAYVGRDNFEDIYDIQTEFNTAIVMANEALMESNYTEQLMTAINEAEGDQQQQPTDNQQQNAQPATTEEKKPGVIQKAAQSVLEWLKTIIGKLGDTMKRFQARIEEMIAQKGPDRIFWERNGENIKKLTLSDTKVNDWYKYNIPSFKNSTYVKFDINDQDLKDDKALQDKIMKQISTNLPNFDEKDTFSQKINKIYQGEYVKEENGEGKTLQSINYNHGDACKFVEDFIARGFGSEGLGSVLADYTKVDEDYKNASKNYQNLASQMKANEPATTQATEQKAEPQNASAIEEDDFRFNLAEHFGLIHNEASFTVGQNDSQSVAANGGNQVATNNKELDAMIKRCFNCNVVAITAKMTNILAAYKQYMQLFKAVYKPGKQEAKNAEKAEQNNQQQQQSNNNQEQK